MRDYKLLYFKASDYKDSFGNTWCDAAFEGVSEPVKWVVKDVGKVELGKLYYGEITMETSKANKPYQRFRSKQKPDVNTAPTGSSEVGLDIRAQFAIKTAVNLLKDPEHEVKADLIEHWAGIFYDMVDLVKNHKTEAGTKPPLRNWESVGQKDKVNYDIPDNAEDVTYDDVPPASAYDYES